MTDTTNDYTFWQAALAGNPPELRRGVAEAGFYRNRTREGTLEPIAIWRDDKGLCAKVGARAFRVKDEEEFCEHTFAWCAENPVTQDAYNHFMANGTWPDEVPDVSAKVQERLSNAPADVVLAETIKELRAEAEAWLKEIGGEVTTQEQANKAGNFSDRFSELAKEADTARVAEKEPHLKASREVDGKWKPVEAAGSDAKKWAKGLLTPFLKAEQARKLQAMAEKAAGGETVKASDIKVKAGSRGRGVSLRTVKELRVTDYEALWAHYVADDRFKKHPDVVRTLGKMAEGDLGVGLNVPGAKIEENQVAA